MEDLADMTAPAQGTPVSVNSAHPEHEQVQQNVTAEVNLVNGQGDNEEEGTAGIGTGGHARVI